MSGMLQNITLFGAGAAVSADQILSNSTNHVQNFVAAEAGKHEHVANTSSSRQMCDVTVIMVRHGERIDETWHQGGFRNAVAQGHVWMGDPWLSEHGREQCHNTAQTLKQSLGSDYKNYFTKVYTSPLQRCIRTAEPFAQALGKPVQIVNALSELEKQVHNMGLRPETMRRMDWYKHHYEKTPGIEYSDAHADADSGLWNALNRIGHEECGENGRAYILAVTHRESMHQACKLSGEKCKIAGFASMTGFRYQLSYEHGQAKMLGPRIVLPTTTDPYAFYVLRFEIQENVKCFYKFSF
jgi:broad specificity phosphatase PhoE